MAERYEFSAVIDTGRDGDQIETHRFDRCADAVRCMIEFAAITTDSIVRDLRTGRAVVEIDRDRSLSDHRWTMEFRFPRLDWKYCVPACAPFRRVRMLLAKDRQ
jgi:hypothetical protein